MNKITRKHSYTYTTSDGDIFTGKFALKGAKRHQKELDFRKAIKDVVPEAQKIFGVDTLNDLKIDAVMEDKLVNRINNEFSWDVDDFEDFLNHFAGIYLEIPELFDLSRFIEKRFDTSNLKETKT